MGGGHNAELLDRSMIVGEETDTAAADEKLQNLQIIPKLCYNPSGPSSSEDPQIGRKSAHFSSILNPRGCIEIYFHARPHFWRSRKMRILQYYFSEGMQSTRYPRVEGGKGCRSISGRPFLRYGKAANTLS